MRSVNPFVSGGFRHEWTAKEKIRLIFIRITRTKWFRRPPLINGNCSRFCRRKTEKALNKTHFTNDKTSCCFPSILIPSIGENVENSTSIVQWWKNVKPPMHHILCSWPRQSSKLFNLFTGLEYRNFNKIARIFSGFFQTSNCLISTNNDSTAEVVAIASILRK